MSDRRLAITIDLDWAPDAAIDAVAARLIAAGLPATWFVTHASPAVDRLLGHPALFELGIHPNVQPGSTHGPTPEAVLDHLLGVVSRPVASRSHGLVTPAALLAGLVARGIGIDSSVFVPDTPGLRPFRQHTPRGDLWRVPVAWADDHELLAPCFDSASAARALDPGGVRVLLFHPIHIALNSRSHEDYTAFKARHPSLDGLDGAALAAEAAPGDGIASMFEEALDRALALGGACRLTELL